jgi:uncharacterized protein YndB with AHSA1/START domain
MSRPSDTPTGEDSVRRTVRVPAPLDRAFATFAEAFGRWWPREYTWGKDVLEAIGLEPREGGLCFERGPHGFTCHWGRVLLWDPPRRLVFSWQISPRREPEPNPAKASEVEVRFEADGPGATRVALEHRGFARHGEGGDAYRAALGSAEGWAMILDRYAGACGSASS